MVVDTVTWVGVRDPAKALADVDLQMTTMAADISKRAAVVAAATAAAARPSGQSLKAELRTRLGLVGRVKSTGANLSSASVSAGSESAGHRWASPCATHLAALIVC
jgi:hypothetical protein